MNLNFKSNYKIKLVLAVLVLTTLFVTVYNPGLYLYGEENENVWVLRDVIDYDSEERIRKANKEKEDFHYEINYSRGNYTHKRTYTGKTKSMKAWPDMVHGESVTIKAEWSSPPRIMRPGEK